MFLNFMGIFSICDLLAILRNNIYIVFVSQIQSLITITLTIGSEAELSGFFLICGQILGWMFPLLFSILIERDVQLKYGVVVVATGFLIGCALLMLTSSWEEIVEEASHPMIHAATKNDTIENTHKIIDPSSNRSGTDDALGIQSQPENEVEKAF